MRKLLILIIVLFTSNFVRAQWKGIEPSDSTIWYSDVQFLNKDTGFMTMPLGYLPIKSAHTHLYSTKNGGKTWDFIDSMYDEVYFHYFDYSHAIFQCRDWADRSKAGQPGATGRFGLWYSKNGGKTRDSIPNTMLLTPPQFISKQIGFCTNLPYYSLFPLTDNIYGPIYKTKDGGMTWYKVSDINILPRKIHFPSDTTIGYVQYFTFGKNDSINIIKTIDGGEHWNKIYSRHYHDYPDYSDASEEFVFITKDMILHTWDTAAFISKDGGNTWHSTYFPRPYGLNKFYFTDTSTVFASTQGYLAKDSTGSGFYWGLSNYSDSIYTPDIYFPNKDFAYAFTPVQAGTLIYTLQKPQKWNGVITAVKESIFHDEVLEIFPNPASGWVNLKGYGFKPGKAELFCRDMLGRTVYNITMQAGNDGTLQGTIDISNLRQGMYQVEVWQGNFKQEKKLMVK